MWLVAEGVRGVRGRWVGWGRVCLELLSRLPACSGRAGRATEGDGGEAVGRVGTAVAGEAVFL